MMVVRSPRAALCRGNHTPVDGRCSACGSVIVEGVTPWRPRHGGVGTPVQALPFSRMEPVWSISVRVPGGGEECPRGHVGQWGVAGGGKYCRVCRSDDLRVCKRGHHGPWQPNGILGRLMCMECRRLTARDRKRERRISDPVWAEKERARDRERRRRAA